MIKVGNHDVWLADKSGSSYYYTHSIIYNYYLHYIISIIYFTDYFLENFLRSIIKIKIEFKNKNMFLYQWNNKICLA